MRLILDHINGVGDDHRLENLRIVCPNSAATLETHGGKNVRPLRVCAQCQAPYFPSDQAQHHCSPSGVASSPRNRASRTARRTVERPPETGLRAQVAALGYLAVGPRYGVSDDAMRKWLRFCERERVEGP